MYVYTCNCIEAHFPSISEIKQKRQATIWREHICTNMKTIWLANILMIARCPT